MTNAQSTLSGSVFKYSQVPPNWWGYGMPPEFVANSSGTSQVADMIGKAPMASAPPLSAMTQYPQYSTTTTARLLLGILKYQRSRCLTHRQIQCRRSKGL